MMMEVILTEEQRKMYNVAAHVWYIFLFVFFVVRFHILISLTINNC